jgi:hypothetical protein
MQFICKCFPEKSHRCLLLFLLYVLQSEYCRFYNAFKEFTSDIANLLTEENNSEYDVWSDDEECEDENKEILSLSLKIIVIMRRKRGKKRS